MSFFARDAWIHLPTPGDHYSPATGSALMTVIYNLAKNHQAAGGATRVIVSDNTRHDYDVGECDEVPFVPLPSRNQKILDVATGALGLRRRNVEATYRPALGAIDPDFNGAIFVYNQPGVIRMIRRHAPRAFIGLYCQNDLFRTYTRYNARRVVNACDLVIHCSGYLTSAHAAKLGSQNPKLVTVYNGVDLDTFVPADPPPDNAEPVILFVGRMVPNKGVGLLIDAALKLQKRGLKFKLRIVGSMHFDPVAPLTPFEQGLRQQAEPLGDAVEFRPFTDRHRIVGVYQQADIFCVPSNWDEPFGLTVAEGMACGLPMVVSRRGGIPEVGADSVLYFDPPDINTLADQIARLIEDPDYQARVGQRSRERAEQFNWRHSYQQLNGHLSDA
ncbi:MAG: glycosyltransferase family 4 protein [Planctomycetota bacterium]